MASQPPKPVAAANKPGPVKGPKGEKPPMWQQVAAAVAAVAVVVAAGVVINKKRNEPEHKAKSTLQTMKGNVKDAKRAVENRLKK